MTDYLEYFNPELEAILQEIALDPRAKMLKVPSSGALVYATRQPRVGIAAPGLTSAERQLLTVHRDELADRLKERCLIDLYATEEANKIFHRSVAVGQELEIRDRASWAADTNKLLDRQLDDQKVRLATDVLRDCIAPEGERVVSVTQLATAMMRTVPLKQGIVYVGMDLFRAGRLTDALNMQTSVLDGGSSGMLASYVFDNIAHVQWNMMNFREALEASIQGARADHSRIIPLLSAVDIAARIGDFESAEHSCARLDELNCPDDKSISWFADKNRVAVSLATPTPNARRQIRKLMERVGDVSREILNAALQ